CAALRQRGLQNRAVDRRGVNGSLQAAQMALAGAKSSQWSWRSLWWDTRGKKHNACVERLSVPLFFNSFIFLTWRSPLGSANRVKHLYRTWTVRFRISPTFLQKPL